MSSNVGSQTAHHFRHEVHARGPGRTGGAHRVAIAGGSRRTTSPAWPSADRSTTSPPQSLSADPVAPPARKSHLKEPRVRTLHRPALPIVAVHDHPIRMRDAVILRADVYRPAVGGPVPTLLVRHPYGPAGAGMAPVIAALEAGFAVVNQHCRGRGNSDGEFRPWSDEPSDGADTINWITAQEWSNGKVVGYGVSYLASTALMNGVQKPAGYVGAVAMQTPADLHDDLTYIGGALALGSAQYWATLQAMLGGMHAMTAGEDARSLMAAAMPALQTPGAARASLPLSDSLGLPGAAPYWSDWMRHPSRDEYWTQFAAPRDNYANIGVPVYHVAGWFDLFLTGTLENRAGLLAVTGDPATQPLVIGPWTHNALLSTGAGAVDFGPAATSATIQLDQDQMAFLRGLATDGTPGGVRPPVRIFVMGDNVWRDEQEWPLARTEYTPWYFQPSGGLAPVLPAAGATPSTYVSDPHDPVPTVGGNLLLPEFNQAGPHDQRVLDGRTDVLRFVSASLERDVEVTGPLSVVLYAATDAADSDWTAKLMDVHPDGKALNLADGVVRARYRNRTSEPDLPRPGQTYEYTISLGATSQVFKAGHRIRVDIASANFPRFDRNPGNGTLSADATEADLTVQHQTVFHDSARPSHIVLPLIAR